MCVNRDGKRDWFLLNTPKHSHKGLAVSATITCQHVCSLLSKKNLFLTFDDTNGIGTAQYLLEQALQNTGWTLRETLIKKAIPSQKVNKATIFGLNHTNKLEMSKKCAA